MAKFVEVLVTGISVRGRVRSAGDVVQVADDFNIQSKKDQVKRWGQPKYKEISQPEFEGRGGEPKGIPEAVEGIVTADNAGDSSEPLGDEAQEQAERREELMQNDLVVDEGGEIVPAPEAASTEEFDFSDVEGKNAEETLQVVSEYDDAKLNAFIAHETSGQNRKSVLGPLGAVE